MKTSGRASPRLKFLAVALVVLLAAKYLWSLTVSDIPFGYDAGIYQFLFARHAEGWPPFLTAALPEWARSHPLGLFAFTSPLVHAGMPAQWLTGWIWNAFAVAVPCVLASVFLRRSGAQVAVAVLAVALLSVAQYEGFAAMYWKVFAALAWTAPAFRLLELRDRRWVLCGMLVVATHLQVGLVLMLSVASLFAFQFFTGYRRESMFVLWTGMCTLALGLAWYLPNYAQAIQPVLSKVGASLNPLTVGVAAVALTAVAVTALWGGRVSQKSLSPRTVFLSALACIVAAVLGGGLLAGWLLPGRTDAASGSFLSLSLYVRLSLPLILLGVFGFMHSVRSGELGSPWQWALVWCAALVFSQFFFYLRFLLLLDFFLLPFAAQMLVRLWFMREHALRWLAVALLCIQAILSVQRLQELRADISREELDAIRAAAAHVPDGAAVVSLDNYVAPWVLGSMPHAQVAGPGLFASPSYEVWEKFIYGTSDDRHAFYDFFPRPLYLYVGKVFLTYYPPETSAALLADPCLRPTPAEGLVRVECSGR